MFETLAYMSVYLRIDGYSKLNLPVGDGGRLLRKRLISAQIWLLTVQ